MCKRLYPAAPSPAADPSASVGQNPPAPGAAGTAPAADPAASAAAPAACRQRAGGHSVLTLCRLAVLAALYVLLTMMLSLRAGNLRITFASLPVVVAALLLGPGEAVAVAGVGEFLNQLISPYGLTVTTPLWLVPPAARGLLIGLCALWCLRRGRPLEERPAAYFAVLCAAALCTTLLNTAVILADSLIFHYYTPGLIAADLAVRLLTGLLTAAAVGIVALAPVRLLRRQGLAGIKRRQTE